MKHNFTKLIIALVMLTYFSGAGIGIYMVVKEPTLLGELLTYIGVPTSTAIGFYAWKAKAENVIKIRQSLNNQILEIHRRLARLPPEQREEYNEIKLTVESILAEIDE